MSDRTKQYAINDISEIGRKQIKYLYISIIFLTVLVLGIIYFLLPEIFGDKGSNSPQLRQMSMLTAKIGNLETEVQEKQEALFNLIKKYSVETGELLPALSALGFSDEEKKILNDKVLNAKDSTIKSILKDILGKNNDINEIKGKIKKFEALLPIPNKITKETNHFQIAMDFLLNEKRVEKKKALRLVERTALFGPLIPGFKVWNFYYGDEFITHVTQGDAAISPNEFRKNAHRYLINIMDRAIAETEKKAAEIKKLESTRKQLISQVEDLDNKKKNLTKELTDLSENNKEMLRIINSLFYIIDLKQNLIKRGIIKRSGFLRLGAPKLKEIPLEYFKKRIDLRKKNMIEIYAKEFNLSKIDEITLYPKFYKRGTDYKVEIEKNKQKAVLTILVKEKFKTERVVISVE